MSMLQQLGGLVTVACLVVPAWAQTPAQTPPQKPAQAPAQTPAPTPAPNPAPGAAAPPRKPAPRVAQTAPRPMPIVVRDVSGSPIAGVTVSVSGASKAESTTDAKGTVSLPLAAGSYRLRFEHEDFITLERDITIRTPRHTEIAVALNRAPAPPEPPQPAPPPPPPAPPVRASGPPVNISIPDFVDKSFIGRDPLKESILSCMPDATARLLQLREAVTDHTHSDSDEVLYVVAGDGAVRIGGQVTAIGPGSMSAIPRGTPHAIERRGRNPLIVLSTLAGAPCPVGTSGASGK